MRAYCVLDGKQVYCPNASLSGYTKAYAQVGDWVRGHNTAVDGSLIPIVGRMIARIAYAPGTMGGPVIENWILVMALGENLTHAYERWLDPANVDEVRAAAPDMANWLAWFAGPEMMKEGRDGLRAFAEYGGMHANQDPDHPQWDFLAGLRRWKADQDRRRRERAKWEAEERAQSRAKGGRQ